MVMAMAMATEITIIIKIDNIYLYNNTLNKFKYNNKNFRTVIILLNMIIFNKIITIKGNEWQTY